MSLSLLVATAWAADIGQPSSEATQVAPSSPTSLFAPAWAGLYLGVNGGVGWGAAGLTDNAGAFTSGNVAQAGALAGGTIGFNWQVDTLVLGLEADLDWAGVRGSTTGGFCATINCTTNLQWYGTVRPRVGFAWNNWMPYVTGGAAAGSLSNTIVGGWTAGIGLETKITPNWSANIEYLYSDLGKSNFAGPPLSVAVTERFSLLRAGIRYKFNWSGRICPIWPFC